MRQTTKRRSSANLRSPPPRKRTDRPWIIVLQLAGGTAAFNVYADSKVDAEVLAIALKSGVNATLIDCYDPSGECFRSLLG